MKQFEANGHRCLVVGVEKGASNFTFEKITYDPDYLRLSYRANETDWEEDLPPGNWQIVGTGTADKITDGEAREIVKCHVKPGWNGDGNGLWENYEKGDPLFMSAKESLHSLLKSQGYDNLSEIVLLAEKL